eukprot:CAMPEP_0170756838 /NCGR_PEP_ID=MMETSP0437-20130122/14227_1 /TAXON_ID=0 /ORGANISM="Sexangularia sp." /LENGTH=501 /DNA_ID=CAMNT_0011096025 /DNA_START=57 /DNA_END=1563 /DNA_ORIENTATION=-
MSIDFEAAAAAAAADARMIQKINGVGASAQQGPAGEVLVGRFLVDRSGNARLAPSEREDDVCAGSESTEESSSSSEEEEGTDKAQPPEAKAKAPPAAPTPRAEPPLYPVTPLPPLPPSPSYSYVGTLSFSRYSRYGILRGPSRGTGTRDIMVGGVVVGDEVQGAHQRKVLGIIVDVIGPVLEPHYVVQMERANNAIEGEGERDGDGEGEGERDSDGDGDGAVIVSTVSCAAYLIVETVQSEEVQAGPRDEPGGAAAAKRTREDEESDSDSGCESEDGYAVVSSGSRGDKQARGTRGGGAARGRGRDSTAREGGGGGRGRHGRGRGVATGRPGGSGWQVNNSQQQQQQQYQQYQQQQQAAPSWTPAFQAATAPPTSQPGVLTVAQVEAAWRAYFAAKDSGVSSDCDATLFLLLSLCCSKACGRTVLCVVATLSLPVLSDPLCDELVGEVDRCVVDTDEGARLQGRKERRRHRRVKGQRQRDGRRVHVDGARASLPNEHAGKG